MAKCIQCGRPAVVSLDDTPLCVDCNLKLAQAQNIRDRALKQQHNHLVDMMEARTGLFGVTPRYEIDDVPAPVVNFHNINVDRSVVGAINTGNVTRMEVALNDIHSHNQNAELEQHLKDFTEAVLRDASLSAADKDEIIQQLAALASELAKPREAQAKGVVKAFVTAIASSIPAALIEHWEAIKRMLGF